MKLWRFGRTVTPPAPRKQDHPFVAMLDGPATDVRGMPTFACMCGCTWFYTVARFDQDTRLVGMYLTDGMCALCGTLVTLPTPVDKEIAP